MKPTINFGLWKMTKISKSNSAGKLIIIGAGPAGMACGLELVRARKNKKINVRILEKNNSVGGLARTIKFNGARFDLGPHRFYTKNEEILTLWKNILKERFLEVPRLTRIFYRGKLFLYPIKISDVVNKLGFIESARIFISYLIAKSRFLGMEPKNFEEVIIKDFGERLYKHFFKNYTRKVWGIAPNKIATKWASQRIKNLNFIEAIKKTKAKSLVSKFYYPEGGAGLLYEKIQEILLSKAVLIELNSQVVKIYHKNHKITRVVYRKDGRGKKVDVDFVFSSMPITNFIAALSPPPPKGIIKSSQKLFYRDHITVNLVVENRDLFKDNWIYIHAPEVEMARVTNYSNFSEKMSKNKSFVPISVEYFCFKNDHLWNMSDKNLVNLAINELNKVRLLGDQKITGGLVIRESESYPAYYLNFEKDFEVLKNYVSIFKNLELIGRGGMYKYNNQDHAMFSGITAARNFLSGEKIYDTWRINEDAEYLEEK